MEVVGDPSAHTPRVVKHLQVEPSNLAATVLRLVGISMVDHPYVGCFSSLEPTDAGLDVVREDLPNSWSTWIAEAPSWDELRGRTLHVLDALGALYAEGWSHGGVQPANVRWRAEGPSVVVDGGVCPPRGTSRWAALGADLWDVGALIWGACTGEPPELSLIHI